MKNMSKMTNFHEFVEYHHKNLKNTSAAYNMCHFGLGMKEKTWKNSKFDVPKLQSEI